MAQIAVPIADVDIGNWEDEAAGTTDIYTSIDEGTTSPSEADYITSPAAPSSEGCLFDLTSLTDPVLSTSHILRWHRGKDAAGAQVDLTVNLRQGATALASLGTLIKTVSDTNIPSTAATTSSTLSGGEADAITDYTDLQIHFIANQP